MGCSTCSKTPIKCAVKPVQMSIPTFPSSQIYMIIENSLKFCNFDIESGHITMEELPISDYFKGKFGCFPEFFRIISMRYSLYICGGRKNDVYWKKNFQTIALNQLYTTTERSDMSEDKCNMGVCSLDEVNFAVIGGHNTKVLGTTEIYQTTTNSWIMLASLNIPRFSTSSIVGAPVSSVFGS